MLKAVAAKLYQTAAALTLGAAVVLAAPAAQARSAPEAPVAASGLETIALAQLPRDGRSTYARILQGGPFANDKDGSIFGNRERILPRQPRGYYREYTVRTPGARNRGARRIVCGGPQPQEPDICYYTSDHYSSFRQIVE